MLNRAQAAIVPDLPERSLERAGCPTCGEPLEIRTNGLTGEISTRCPTCIARAERAQFQATYRRRAIETVARDFGLTVEEAERRLRTDPAIVGRIAPPVQRPSHTQRDPADRDRLRALRPTGRCPAVRHHSAVLRGVPAGQPGAAESADRRAVSTMRAAVPGQATRARPDALQAVSAHPEGGENAHGAPRAPPPPA